MVYWVFLSLSEWPLLLSTTPPACHSFIRFSKDVKSSFDFDFREGFFKRRSGITIIALNAISFNGDSRIHSFTSREISSLKLFPACPDGNKRFPLMKSWCAIYMYGGSHFQSNNIEKHPSYKYLFFLKLLE